MPKYDTYSPEVGLYNESGSVPVITPGGSGTQRGHAAANPEVGKGKPASGRRTKNSVRAGKKAAAAEPSLVEKVKAFFLSPTLRIFTGLFLVMFAAYLIISVISYVNYCFVDQAATAGATHGAAQVANAGGEGGARLSDMLVDDGFGIGAVVIIFWLVMVSMKLLTNSRFGRFKTLNFTIKCLIALITVSLIVGLITIGLDTPFNLGGAHGRYVNQFIINYIGWAGAGLLCLFMLALFVGICLADVVRWIMRKHKERQARRAERRAQQEAEEERRREMDRMMQQDILDDANAGEHKVPESAEEAAAAAVVENVDFGNTGADTDASDPEEEDVTYVYDEEKTENGVSAADAGEGSESAAPDGMSMKVNINHIDTVEGDESQLPKNEGKYHFPPVELLSLPDDVEELDRNEQLENKERIRSTLLDFGIPITKIEATVGPTVTLYEIIPEPGIKISSIRSRDEDIARSLSATGVRIIAPMPGKGTVGIEVPNKKKRKVAMRTVLTSRKFQECDYDLPIALGSTISNEVYIVDLAKMPHLLVAGATGQGKSVGLNVMIASLLYRKKPSELKFVMFDPKMVELSLYSVLENHYLAKLPGEEDAIITDVVNKTAPVLSSLCEEMGERYELLKEARVRDIKNYNERFNAGQLSPDAGHRFLPYIVVLVDEYADLVMTAGKEIEKPLARLAQKARAVGIHLIVATQRPSTDVVTGMIKANFPARIAFRVSSGVDSKTILNSTAAQQLIGMGDMLISTGSELTRVQCALIKTEETEAVCNFIAQQPYEDGPYMLPEPLVGGDKEDSGFDESQPLDPLLGEVARLIVNLEQASTSSIQRRFQIGYNRAGRIMDQLERLGVVGPSHGGKPRAVLMDPANLESVLKTVGQ